jgi:hypothetical protein
MESYSPLLPKPNLQDTNNDFTRKNSSNGNGMNKGITSRKSFVADALKRQSKNISAIKSLVVDEFKRQSKRLSKAVTPPLSGAERKANNIKKAEEKYAGYTRSYWIKEHVLKSWEFKDGTFDYLLKNNIAKCIQTVDLHQNPKNGYHIKADPIFTAIASNCPNLKSLTCSRDFNSLNDDQLKAIANNSKHLTELHLRLCYTITDDGLAAVANKCKNLTTLYLSGYEKVTAKSIIAIAKKCKLLTSVELRSYNEFEFKYQMNPAINEHAIIAIAKNCENLTKLHLEYFYLTEKTFEALLKYGPKLSELSIERSKIPDNPALLKKLDEKNADFANYYKCWDSDSDSE